MKSPLTTHILPRLTATQAGDDVTSRVLAALDGDAGLATCLARSGAPVRPAGADV